MRTSSSVSQLQTRISELGSPPSTCRSSWLWAIRGASRSIKQQLSAFDGSSALTTSLPLRGGKASFSVPNLAAGTRGIIATYSATAMTGRHLGGADPDRDSPLNSPDSRNGHWQA